MSEGSMIGSGIYSTEITIEVECACEECNDGSGCGNAEELDFNTDDRGNVDDDVICKQCNHKFNYQKENDPNEGYDEYEPDDD
jgi:hypothetical protein